MCINTANLYLRLTNMGYKEFSRFLTLTVNTVYMSGILQHLRFR